MLNQSQLLLMLNQSNSKTQESLLKNVEKNLITEYFLSDMEFKMEPSSGK